MALAHTVGDKVEAAYRRRDLFQKQRQMMDGWAKFCGTTTSISRFSNRPRISIELRDQTVSDTSG